MADPENATGSGKPNFIDQDDSCPDQESDFASNVEAKRGGFDCLFIDKPPENLPVHCPICFLVLRDPYQVDCCGHIFCQTCIKQVHAKNRTCPTCNTVDFSMFADKRMRHSLYAFRVKCALEKEGCQWVGELGELEKHFNKNPTPDKQLTGCEFIEINCNHCSESLRRHRINDHQNEECSLRPFSCVYCRNYESSYDNVVDHWKMCECHPVSCPNECGTLPDRRSLEQHVSEHCPLALVDCDFCYAGCKSQLSRQDMASHLANSLATHVSLIAAHQHKLSEEIACKDVQLVQLREEFERKSKVTTEHMQRLVAGREGRPQYREWHTYMKMRYIALFFTVLVVVVALGIAVLKQGVAEVNEYVQHSEQDILELTQLVAEHKNIQDYIGKQTAEVKKKQEEIVLMMEEIERKLVGLGGRETEYVRRSEKDILELTQLVAKHKNIQDYIGKQTAEVKKKQEEIVLMMEEIERKLVGLGGRELMDEYVAQCKKDRKHVIKEVAELRNKLELEWHLLKEHSSSLVPIQITIDEFQGQQEADVPWYSQPFYSHVQGYKLCLRVDVNGFGDGRGTHISVHIHLMRGEFDDYLPWPFQGVITLQLLSRDQAVRDHHNGTIPFNDRTANAIANRVFSREISKHGLGYQQFIKIARAKLFLDNHRLHFRISDIQLKPRKQ